MPNYDFQNALGPYRDHESEQPDSDVNFDIGEGLFVWKDKDEMICVKSCNMDDAIDDFVGRDKPEYVLSEESKDNLFIHLIEEELQALQEEGRVIKVGYLGVYE